MPADSDYWGGDHDPYTDPQTGILKNIPGFNSAEALEKFEAMMFQANFPEASAFAASLRQFDLNGWRQIHKICFGDVYDWAGEIRTIRIAKGDTVFAYPEYIEREADRLFAMLNDMLASGDLTLKSTAQLYAEINVIHPFREGNGRTQRVLFAEILERIGHSADYTRLTQDDLIKALIAAYNGDYGAITELFRRITGESRR